MVNQPAHSQYVSIHQLLVSRMLLHGLLVKEFQWVPISSAAGGRKAVVADQENGVSVTKIKQE